MDMSNNIDNKKYEVKLKNKLAPNDEFEIEFLDKDSMFGLTIFFNSLNKSLHEDIYHLTYIDAYDMPFPLEEISEISEDILKIAYEERYNCVDYYTNFHNIIKDFNILLKDYTNLYIQTTVCNCCNLYLFINFDKLEQIANKDNFLNGIKIGSNFEGGLLKDYFINA